jgi:hypothetical protein
MILNQARTIDEVPQHLFACWSRRLAPEVKSASIRSWIESKLAACAVRVAPVMAVHACSTHEPSGIRICHVRIWLKRHRYALRIHWQSPSVGLNAPDHAAPRPAPTVILAAVLAPPRSIWARGSHNRKTFHKVSTFPTRVRFSEDSSVCSVGDSDWSRSSGSTRVWNERTYGNCSWCNCGGSSSYTCPA